MALFRKFFYKKPPDGLLEISDSVYVFDSCFSTDVLEEEESKDYILGIIGQLHDHFPDSSFMVFNFREGDRQSQIASILCDYDMTIMEYPRQYEGCPILTMETIHHFLRSCESWFQLGQSNIILMHCERGGWPVLAFMLAALLIYRKLYTGEKKTLDMIYKQSPRELLQLMSPLNPLPSQLRYLQYVSRRNVGSQWPPLDRALTLDCVIMRSIPNADGEGGCRPIFRIYGQDPFMATDRTPKVLFSTPKRSKVVRHYKQDDCELVKIDIHCHVEGDVVLECISLDGDLEREEMMFRVMFNTAFIRSNILMLNRDEIDTLWNGKDQFPKDFRVEILLSDMDAPSSVISMDMPRIEDKEGLPIEAFAKVQEIFSNVDWLDSKSEIVNVLQQITTSNKLQEILESGVSAIPNNSLNESLSERSKFDPTVSENDISSMTFTVPGDVSTSLESSMDPSSKMKMENLGTEVLSEQNSTASLNQGKQVISTLDLSTDLNIAAKNISLESKSLLKNDTETQKNQSLPLELPMVQEKDPNLISGPYMKGKPMEEKMEPLESKALLEENIKSSTPTTQDKESILSHRPSNDVNFVRTETSKTISLSEDNTNILTSTAQTKEPSPPHEPQHMKVALHLSAQSKIISPRVHQASQSAPSLHYSSSQGSLAPVSRYHGAPSALGITALLQDHAEEDVQKEVNHEVIMPSSSSTLSPSILEVPNYIDIIPKSYPPISSTTMLRSLKLESLPDVPTVTNNNVAPLGLPVPTSELTQVSVTQQHENTMHDKSKKSTVSPPEAIKSSISKPSENAPKAPLPPPPPSLSTTSKTLSMPPPPPPGKVPLAPGPPSVPRPPGAPFGAKGRGLSRPNAKAQEKHNLKPYHWLKLTRVSHGSLWDETQKPEEASKAPEFDMSELENLFSASAPNSDIGGKGGISSRIASGAKTEKVQLIELRRAYNCEIMLSKVKIPLPDLMSSVLALDDSALDVDQVENLIKFCPTKEEMELLNNYTGDKDNLGRCEQFFLELMKVPRVGSKLRVFSFKIQFGTQVSELKRDLNIVNSASEEIRNSVKLKRIMQTILSLGNALNHGTARGAAIGFRLDSLLKLTDTRARNNKMTLMHYLCKVLAEKLPELLDFSKDLESLEASTKIQLKYLAEEMQAISKGLEKVVQELAVSENDGPVSENFCKILKEFLSNAEADVRSLAQLYSNVGRNADALAYYFGEDPTRCPFEQVVSTLLNFVKMFERAHEDNCKQLELEKKKAMKEAENDKLKLTHKKESEQMIRTPIESGNIIK